MAARSRWLPMPSWSGGGRRVEVWTTVPKRRSWDRPGLVDTPNAFAKGVMMPKSRPPYSPEFRRQMVDLARSGRDPDDLAREFEPTAQWIRNWIVQADKKKGRRKEALPGLVPLNAMSCLGSGGRTGSSVWSATSSQPRPGLPGRAARCRRALPVHEREPGLLPDRHHGARARALRLQACSACPRLVSTPDGSDRRPATQRPMRRF